MSYFSVLAQYSSSNGVSNGSPIPGVIFGLVELTLVVLSIAGLWAVFAKAGYPGWASLIPFYNIYVMLKVAGRPGWWLILCFIPFVNLIIIVIPFDIAKRFGKGTGFGIGLLLLGFIFYPILGFGDAVYQPPTEPRGFEVITRQ
ncbi:MAG: DUF5684 domain-containing protein [Tepidisphaeraceae bacterium]|jgi:hypothetical protein